MKIHLGTYFDVPLYLHWSWFLIIPFILLTQGAWSLPATLLLFFFVVLHEYGHCLAAMYFGLRTKDVTLYPLGGLARIQVPGNRPLQEFVIAIAGPLVNLFFVLISIVACLLLPSPQEFTTLAALWTEAPFFTLCLMVFVTNFMLGAFNLLPIFPMDGGRVFRSIVCGISGNYYLSTVVAVRVSQLLCVFGFMLGIYWMNVFLSLIMILMALAAQQELVFAEYCSSVQNIRLKVATVLGRPDLLSAPLTELIVALEDIDDEETQDRLQTVELIPLLRDAVEHGKVR